MSPTDSSAIADVTLRCAGFGSAVPVDRRDRGTGQRVRPRPSGAEEKRSPLSASTSRLVPGRPRQGLGDAAGQILGAKVRVRPSIDLVRGCVIASSRAPVRGSWQRGQVSREWPSEVGRALNSLPHSGDETRAQLIEEQMRLASTSVCSIRSSGCAGNVELASVTSPGRNETLASWTSAMTCR